MSALIFRNMPVFENLLHAGLGLVSALDEGLESGKRTLLASFQELAEQGSCDHSEMAEGLRNRLDFFINGWYDFSRALGSLVPAGH